MTKCAWCNRVYEGEHPTACLTCNASGHWLPIEEGVN
jgi:uncharacterized protein YbaR (Trm112 family)